MDALYFEPEAGSPFHARDRRRGWERLGHASLFAFLTRELGLSDAAAYHRFTAARLLPRFPAVEVALRSGQLCLSTVGELARVLTAENEAKVLPRFFGCSSRQAREVAAALLPRLVPPRRAVVTALPRAPLARGRAQAVPVAPLFSAVAASGDVTTMAAAGSLPGASPHDAAQTASVDGLRAHLKIPHNLRRVSRRDQSYS
jgi:hypothetical protein